MLVVICFSSCSNLKYLPPGEKLYTGADLKIIETEPVKNKKVYRSEAASVIRPEPNSKVLGLKIKLWLYNISGEPKGKGLRYFLKNKIGEPPVLFSKVNPTQVTDFINTRLFNKGIYHAFTEYKIDETEKKAHITYISTIHAPYTIGNVTWPDNEDDLSNNIKGDTIRTRLRRGRTYDLDRLNAERERINDRLKERGFYFFNSDYILFEADTSAGNKTVDIHVAIKDNVPYKALLIYRLNEIYLTPDYSLRDDSVKIQQDTIVFENVHYIAADKSYRPKTLIRSVFLRKGEIYSRNNHSMTLSGLTEMGVFKFVNVRFNEQDSLSPGYLNAYIYLTPLPRKSIRGEIEVVSKSNNFLGPALTLSYNNRNSLNGAELLVINAHTSFETQINGRYKGLFSYELGPEINLYVPRFILPFRIRPTNGYFVPKTRFTIGYDFLKRVQYFNLNSLKFIYGYHWKESEIKEHELNPVNINFTRLNGESDEFKQLLEINPLLRKSFEEQFIPGANYSYTYNEQIIERKKNQTYFNGNIELAGNLISLASKTIFDKNPDSNAPLKIAGSVYSQYIRADADLRHFRRINQKVRLAGRLYAGAGWAYGNSSTLPYIKQFFSGGASSVRAFRIRALGPGTYLSPDSSVNSLFFEQGGDIKLEANAELRFNIISILKGALFTDAGNVWLLRNNPAIPGGQFNTKTFAGEIAVGTGFGLRIDANFFVLRFDLAFPLRKPWLKDEDRWVINKIKFGDSSWRRENLVLNIAIGYPF